MFTQVPGMQAINVRTVQHSPRADQIKTKNVRRLSWLMPDRKISKSLSQCTDHYPLTVVDPGFFNGGWLT